VSIDSGISNENTAPPSGAFSAFAWVKVGLPEQAIISQTDGFGYGAAWLCADSSGGKLMTKLMDPQPRPTDSCVGVCVADNR